MRKLPVIDGTIRLEIDVVSSAQFAQVLRSLVAQLERGQTALPLGEDGAEVIRDEDGTLVGSMEWV